MGGKPSQGTKADKRLRRNKKRRKAKAGARRANTASPVQSK